MTLIAPPPPKLHNARPQLVETLVKVRLSESEKLQN